MRITAEAFHVRVDPTWYYAWETEEDGPADRELSRRMTLAQRRAATLVGVRTGKLLSTIRKERGINRKGLHWDVVAGQKGKSGTPYLGWHHYGTPPHVITVRKKRLKSLRFTVNGQVVFRRKVMHPGTTGSFFLEFALTAAAG